MSGLRFKIPFIRKPYVQNGKGEKICVGEVVEYDEEKDGIRIALNFAPNLDPVIKKQCEEKPEAISFLAFPQKPVNLLIIP